MGSPLRSGWIRKGGLQRWRGAEICVRGVAGVMNTAYVRDGFVYSGGRKGLFRCIEIETGRRVWAAEEPLRKADGSGRGPWLQAFTVHHEPSGRTLIFNDHGEMIVAELSPKKYHEVSRMSIIDPTPHCIRAPLSLVSSRSSKQAIILPQR
jgi:hypothetical protein